MNPIGFVLVYMPLDELALAILVGAALSGVIVAAVQICISEIKGGTFP